MEGITAGLYDRIQVLAEDSFTAEDRLRAMEKPLLAWYKEHARVLPWRENPQAYRVWISEIMLQQTRVEAVKPYFERFMKELPAVRNLAEVEDDRLMKLWEGLGYYSRARNLKKAAIEIMGRYGGEIPSSYEELIKLPGIGSYTAGAVASIAYGIPVPAVDGNVLRVVSRVTGSREDIAKQSVKKKIEEMIGKVMPPHSVSSYNQGLIEIGAVVCVPNGEPHCKECPLLSVCEAAEKGLTGEIPVKTGKKARKIEEMTVCLIEWEGKYGIRKRSSQGLLASLYELPNTGGYPEGNELLKGFGLDEETAVITERLPDAKHIFSHVEWHMRGYRIEISGRKPNGFIFADKDELKTEYPLPNALQVYETDKMKIMRW
ncbi:A/G-specific adenine glycosylase [Clostridium sp. AM58-1XD]|nr:A/G-specific adenine glycosylase [Clostridium sp. AM58-1XD]RGY99645.1 A/G-specific adenine glycosylase [Clostridium sp. AM58-1XD]